MAKWPARHRSSNSYLKGRYRRPYRSGRYRSYHPRSSYNSCYTPKDPLRPLAPESVSPPPRSRSAPPTPRHPPVVKHPPTVDVHTFDVRPWSWSRRGETPGLSRLGGETRAGGNQRHRVEYGTRLSEWDRGRTGRTGVKDSLPLGGKCRSGLGPGRTWEGDLETPSVTEERQGTVGSVSRRSPGRRNGRRDGPYRKGTSSPRWQGVGKSRNEILVPPGTVRSHQGS